MIEIWNGQQTEWKLEFEFEQQDKGGQMETRCEKTTQGQLVMVVGLGCEQEFTPLLARRAVAKGISELKKLSVKSAVVEPAAMQAYLGADTISVVAQAARLALFQPEKWKKEQDEKIFQVYISAGDKKDPARDLAQALKLAGMVLEARNLVNRPANMLTPEIMAQTMAESAKKAGLETEVLGLSQIKALGMNAFLAVGCSSGNEPKLIVIRYNGNPETSERIALVGKGICCDTGGYCIKPSGSMGGMRGDMAGAAAVYGAIMALAGTGAKVNATAVIPAAENRISRDSFLPGDVLVSMSGKTIEVGNTDAEGRLILADAVTYAIRKEGATRIVDIATLTGGVVAALGYTTAGMLTSDEEFAGVLQKAAQKGGEQYWPLPVFPEYKKMIQSPVADLQNVSSDGCSSITAGLFIGEFTEKKPWIHLDIAGTAWTVPPKWEFQSSGATGAGVTTLYHLCRMLAED